MYGIDQMDATELREAVLGGMPYQPVYVKVKLVWACNLRCIMCNHWRETRGASLSTEKWLDIIDQMIALGTRKLHITGGEPTLHPGLVSIIERAKASGIKVVMTTNATLIDKKKAKALVKGGLRQVNVSIDSPSRQTHDKIRGRKGAWKWAVKGLTYLRRYTKKPGIRINMVIGRSNFEDVLQLPDFAANLGVDGINLIPVDAHTPELKPLTRAMIEDYNARIAPIVADKALEYGLVDRAEAVYPFGEGSKNYRYSKHGLYAQGYYDTHRCYAPWTHVLIDHQGQVRICCMLRDKPTMGDLQKQTLSEVWESVAYTALRRKQQYPYFEACRQCDHFLTRNREMDDLANSAAIQLRSEKVSSKSKRLGTSKSCTSDSVKG